MIQEKVAELARMEGTRTVGGVQMLNLTRPDGEHAIWAHVDGKWVPLVWGNYYGPVRINRVEIDEKGVHVMRQPGSGVDDALKLAVTMIHSMVSPDRR